jgi:hypothetical protein
MEIKLIRVTELHNSTIGQVFINNKFFCYSLELRWLNNQRSISCIPKGRYQLKKRVTENRGEHILVANVPNRSFILIHSASTYKDLRGCISLAYNQTLTKTDIRNSQSKIAVNDFNQIVFEQLAKSDVWLVIE